jgi:T-complex protein 1 subunit delta
MSENTQTQNSNAQKGEMQLKDDKKEDIRLSNIQAAKSIADIMRTSLGPKGMDKLIETSKGEVLITNDGATILKNLSVLHPTAKLLIQTSKAQDIEAGDGTTSVVILAGAFLEAAEILIRKGIHPTRISDGFSICLNKALEVLNRVAKRITLTDEEELIECVKTSLSSKIVSQNSTELAPIALRAIKNVINIETDTNVDLKNIHIVKKSGGTMDDIQLFNGLVFTDNKPSGTKRINNPKIAMIQFCISSPKTDLGHNVVVDDYSQIDRILKQERNYILKMVKKISESGANIILIQKSVLRDAINDLALHFLKKKGITVIKNIERTEVPFICKTIGCIPVAHIDSLTADKLGTAEYADDVTLSDGSKVYKIEVPKCKTATILIRGTSNLIMDEADRSIHDALCVIRSIVKNRGIVAGGGAIEIEIWRALEEESQKAKGVLSLIMREYAEALEVIPFTLAQNCGLNPVKIVTEMRNKHLSGFTYCGLKARTGQLVDNALEHKIMQPALVNISALSLATEVTRMILKIDDILDSR